MTAIPFPEFITARRRELDLTLGDVAAGLGVSPITVSNWSNGAAKPKPDNLVALANLLQIPAEKLAAMAGVPLGTGAAVNLLQPKTAPMDSGEDEASTEPELTSSEPEAAEAAPVTEPAPDTSPEPEAEPGEPAGAVIPGELEGVSVPPTDPGESDHREPEPVTPVPAASTPPEESPAAAIPAFVSPPSTADPAPKRIPTLRRAGPVAAPTIERGVTTLPLTYIEDPRQLTRYRIRWALTLVVLVVMFFILLWASRELLSALSEVKQAVTPGGISGG